MCVGNVISIPPDVYQNPNWLYVTLDDIAGIIDQQVSQG